VVRINQSLWGTKATIASIATVAFATGSEEAVAKGYATGFLLRIVLIFINKIMLLKI